ncbi:DUF4386 family protein [Arthrobacter dokdonensis]|uniref:DUF4386 family protein n=1 Tax=Arthrobacter dokdonellae TaxID=2211210 RepID=UPI001F30E195|nr:DUF4386 family protein [Arthrobacter dokdonellae]
MPRIFPIVAFIGAPLLLASDIAVFFGTYGQVSPIAALAALPVAAFELSLGLWLIVKCFRQSPLTPDGPVDPSSRHPVNGPAVNTRTVTPRAGFPTPEPSPFRRNPMRVSQPDCDGKLIWRSAVALPAAIGGDVDTGG